jgi:hypothetical protein
MKEKTILEVKLHIWCGILILTIVVLEQRRRAVIKRRSNLGLIGFGLWRIKVNQLLVE